MREKVLVIETIVKLPTILMYVLFAVLFPPLHSKQVVRPVVVFFPR